MYRTELQPQSLNPRGAQRFRLLVVAVLAFTTGAASVAYVNRLAPFDGTHPATRTALEPVAAGADVWHPTMPATSSVYHGQPLRAAPGAGAAAPTRGCVYAPPVPATSSVYRPDCVVPTLMPVEPRVSLPPYPRTGDVKRGP